MEVEKAFDYFAEGKNEFYNKFSHESILCQGNHWKETPFVTILIMTYKRPDLLRQALESAINQKGFDDYQIIVADNEGKPIVEETPTARLLKDYQNEKVIYYRYSEEVLFRTDAPVSLARSPWIVFLHDDDLLAENHLAVMTSIIRKHKEIKFLGCPVKDFVSEHDIQREKTCIDSYIILKYLKDATCLGDWTGWLGALISRKHYIATGGIPSNSPGCGDKVMVAKFLYHFNLYMCVPNRALYYYRRGDQQISFTRKEMWERVLVNEYYFYKYVINKYHKFTHKIWERNIAYLILQYCDMYNKGIYHVQIDVNHVISVCNMPSDIKERNILYYAIKLVFHIYGKCIHCLDCLNRKLLKRTDMHIVV